MGEYILHLTSRLKKTNLTIIQNQTFNTNIARLPRGCFMVRSTREEKGQVFSRESEWREINSAKYYQFIPPGIQALMETHPELIFM